MQRGRPGQSAVELGLLAPLFILLIVVVVDLGRFFAAYTNVSNSAREAAYFGSRSVAGGLSDDSIRKVAAEEGSDARILPDATHVAIAYPAPDLIEVTVRSPFAPVAPFVGAVAGGDIWLTSRVVFPLPLATVTSPAGEPPTPPPPTATPTPSPTSTETPTPVAPPVDVSPTPTGTPTPSPAPTEPVAAEGVPL